MADLYRRSALERLSSPEQLDKSLKVTSPLSWLALIALTLIIAVVVVWSIVGSIPVTITVNGMLVDPATPTQTVFMPAGGTDVISKKIAGERVSIGEPLFEYRDEQGNTVRVNSPVGGMIADVMINAETALYKAGTPLYKVTPQLSEKNPDPSHIALVYVALADSQKLKEDMTVYIEPQSLDTQKYGHMQARILRIDGHVSDNVIEGQQFSGAAVTCELYIAKDSENGFWWSNKKGRDLTLTGQNIPVTARIVVEEIHPIEKLFTKISEIWG